MANKNKTTRKRENKVKGVQSNQTYNQVKEEELPEQKKTFWQRLFTERKILGMLYCCLGSSAVIGLYCYCQSFLWGQLMAVGGLLFWNGHSHLALDRIRSSRKKEIIAVSAALIALFGFMLYINFKKSLLIIVIDVIVNALIAQYKKPYEDRVLEQLINEKNGRRRLRRRRN